MLVPGATLLCISIILAPVAFGAAWHVGKAPVRFELGLSTGPTHSSAGYFAHLPDGGILPGPFPLTRVLDSGGTELKSYTLWQNSESGLGIVFEDPSPASRVYVYVAGSGKPRLWSPACGLTPSPILCADPDSGGMRAARRLARLGKVGPRVHYRRNPEHPMAPLSIRGDLSGRPRPCALYLLAYLATTDPGRTWIAPISISGKSEVLIEGRPVVPHKRIDKWGGTGQWMDLNKGLHRLEIFSACSGSGTFAAGRGVMWLAWKPPNTSVRELGGKRADNAPFAGTSAWASRVVRSDEIVRSGQCTIREVSAQDGGPVARVSLEATHNYWFADEDPILIYKLQAFSAGNPGDTEYVWTFAGGAEVTGKETAWFFPGNMDNSVTLTAVSGGRQSRCVQPFYAYSPIMTSLNDPAARAAFRSTCLNVFRATASGTDPTAGWSQSRWNNFFRTLDLGQGKAMLAELFKKHWDTLRRSLTPERKTALQDLFILVAADIDPQAAVRWVMRFERDADPRRAARLQLKRAEILMYYLDDLQAAREAIGPLSRRRDEAGEWARIRMGDVEFLACNLNEATRLYGDVQNRFRISQAAREKTQPHLATRLARSKEELEAQARRGAPGSRAAGPVGRAEDWKVQAVVDVSASETVSSLLEQAAYREAYEALGLWERQFPLSKISGDFIVVEARLYMALGHHKRARRTLEAYCDQIDATSFIPQALETLLTCMMYMKESDEKLREYCDKVRKRLEFHPVADRFESMLRLLRDNETEREPTRDTL